MNTIVVKADNKVTKTLLEIFKAFGLSFEVKQNEGTDKYNQDFVDMVLSRSKNAEAGNFVVLDEELKKELFGK